MTEKANIVLDASKIDLFETCPARYNFRHNFNKTLPIAQKAKALDMGTLAHEGLAVYYQGLSDKQNYEDRMGACLTKIYELSSDASKSNSDDEEVRTIASAVEQSCDYWRAEDENCLEILAIEQPFAYALFEDEFVRIIITGKIDLLVNYHGIGNNASYENLPIDHKTFSRDSKILRKSNQFINYCAAVGSNYLTINRIGLQKTLKPEQKFVRPPLSYDPIYIADWKKNLTKMLLNEYMACVAEDYWPEKPTSCNKFNRLCEYYEGICDRSGQDSKNEGFTTQFITAEPWDVTKGMTND